MSYNNIDILAILEVLAVIANGVAVLTGLTLCSTVLAKSIIAKRNKVPVNAEEFDSHYNLFQLMKNCGYYGFFLQFFGWLIFSSKHVGLFSLSDLTLGFALSWAILCILNLTFGVASRIMNGKETKNTLLLKKTAWMMFFSILYFVVNFLIY